ncbi:TIGR03085 family metal-binding protein [Rhodococcus sp. NPDC058521]|uniref:TIGR03085 family metal-binding protein n=1 Tax=Rhodococcus sp. NPDC058521 TaxID=3346536 RepID=UPI00365DF24C
MTFAQDERHALVDSMTERGADAPTLCGEWRNRDLAAHLILRERRLDAAAGILVPKLAGRTERIQAEIAARPWSRLLDEVRSGPPVWSPLRWIDSLANTGEMFVHHEDVRRAHSGWEPRRLGQDAQKALWSLAKGVARHGYRKAAVRVVLERPSGDNIVVGARDADESVVLRAEPSELLLHAFGRDETMVQPSGEPDAVAAVLALDRGV